MYFWILFTICTVLYAIQFFQIQRQNKKRPPGPIELPIFGSLIHCMLLYPTINIKQFRPWEAIQRYSKLYGDVYSITIGSFRGLVVTSYEAMTELANQEEYHYKLSIDVTRERSFDKELGLIFVEKPEIWVEMRKFSQRTLRDFGFGKRLSMQGVIESEICLMVEKIKRDIKKTNGILTIKTFFALSILNVLWCMIAGRRYDHDDPKLVKMMERNFALTKSQTFGDPFELAFPWVRKFLPFLLDQNYRKKVYEETHNFSRELIQDRIDEGVYNINPENYIDAFIKKIEDTKNDPHSVYTMEQLQIMIEDFLQTGSTTSVGTINYGILFLLLNPKIQKKFQEEIDAFIPQKTVPTLDNIEKMPYTQATILEIHRLAAVVPNPIPRILRADSNYRGYYIPKGTYVFSNHYSVLMDQDYWGDPESFRPERFINEKGEFVPDKRVIHFGLGKRYCIGVALVNSLIPIFITTLFQNFNFAPVPGKKLPSTEPEVGVSRSPYEYKCLVTPRF